MNVLRFVGMKITGNLFATKYLSYSTLSGHKRSGSIMESTRSLSYLSKNCVCHS
jgi:hypothetical protein